MSHIKQIPVLAYDSHFMPLASNTEATKNMTKSDLKNFMNLEKKKEKFNETLFEYSTEHEKTRLLVKDITRNIAIYNYKIKNLKEMKIEGNLEKVVSLVNETRLRIQKKNQLKQLSEIEYNKLFQPFKQKNLEFARNSEMIHMEDDLYVDDINTKNTEKEEKKDKKEKAFLKLIGNLPDELLRVIHSYFTYETRAAILLKTYNPVKMFCALKKSGLQKVVAWINKKYAPSNKEESQAWKVDPKLYTKMKTLYSLFYDGIQFRYSNGYNTKFNLSISEMKTYLQYLFLLFRKFHQHQWCFELYRMIIVCKK